MSEIVRMKKEHIGAIVEIERQCFSDSWSENMLNQELQSDIACYFVYQDDGMVCGYCGMYKTCDVANITNVAVAKEFRRKGIADKLLSSLINEAICQNMCEITLEVRESNSAAINLYKKHGFVILGKRRGYYKNPSEDAYIMTLKLDV